MTQGPAIYVNVSEEEGDLSGLLMRVFIGCDRYHRQSALVLANSLRRRSSQPISITLLEQSQLIRSGLYWRPRDSGQSTDFTFSRFLVPALLNYRGWALYLDGDMLCLDDLSNLWSLRNCDDALMCVQHPEHTWGSSKMGGIPQTSYPRKNWSSLMLFNASRCSNLTPSYVNHASALDLHRFHWLDDDEDIGDLPRCWNYLVDIDQPVLPDQLPSLLHWTLGGPWLSTHLNAGGSLAQLWRDERDRLLQDFLL
jgi:lipopolysaccharide biosynthesis glycosyltransferase